MMQIASGKSGSSVAQNLADVVDTPAEHGGKFFATLAADRVRRSGAEPPQGGGLGKSATAFPLSRAERSKRLHRQETRAEKMRLRSDLKRITHRENFRRCGTRACAASGVGIRLADSSEGRRAGFSGLSTCGSVWLCPVCAAKIAARRADELSSLIKNAQEAGYRLAMVTLTVRHRAEDSLAGVWDAVGSGWHHVVGGSGWKSETPEAFAERLGRWYEQGMQADADKAAGLKVADGAQRAPRGWRKGIEPTRRIGDKERFGVAGWVKAVEVTHGANGWHVHIHTVIAYKGSPEDAKDLGKRMFARWCKGIENKGFTALPDYGVDVQNSREGMGNLGKYLSKLGADLDGIAREVTQGAQKQARGKNRTPFQIGRDAVESGEVQDIAIWQEWAEVAPGHRAMSWSEGFREMFGLSEEEEADEEIAAEETGTDDDTVVVLPADSWRQVRRRPWELLDVAEDLGASGLRRWLDRHGIAWEYPPNPDMHEKTQPEGGSVTGTPERMVL